MHLKLTLGMANRDEFPCNLKESNGVYGYSRIETKRKQIELLESVVSGKNTFVSLPTGYGKYILLVEAVSVVS